MSAGVSPLSVAGASVLMGERSQAQRPGVAFEPSPQPVPSEPSGGLNLPDEQAFKVSTINERLANLAASAGTARRLDLKA
jgi:hypothetical protein